MKPIEGRLQTAEHILARIMQNSYGVKIGSCTFLGENGVMEFSSPAELPEIEINSLEQEINEVISRNLEVRKYLLPREEAEKLVDTEKVPKSIQEIRIVQIGDFDMSETAKGARHGASAQGKLAVSEHAQKQAPGFSPAVFDKRPCKDPHVDNTQQIGRLHIQKLKHLDKGSYRFIFTVN